MNELSIELHVLILKFLNVKDLLNCRLISPYFNSTIKNHIRIKNLIIMPIRSLNDLFQYPNKLLNQSYLINTTSSKLFESEFMQIILSKLKRIAIDCYTDEDFDYIEYLNQFEQFTQLEELFISSIYIGKDSKLKLSKLKSVFMDIYFDASLNFKLKLECQNLNSFWFNDLYRVFSKVCEFFYPFSIKNLEFSSFSIGLSKFKNIENLNIRSGDYNWIDKFNVKLFKNLKSINLHKINKEELVKLRKKVNYQVDLYVFGIEIKDNINYDNLFSKENGYFSLDTFGNSKEEKYICLRDNYSRITKKIYWTYNLDYDHLIKYFNTIPVDLLNKFLNVSLNVNGNEIELNQSNLIEFLKNSNDSIFQIYISNCSFNQEFYDNLHLTIPFLTIFELWESKKQLDNFDFLFNFEYLSTIVIDQKLPLIFISKLFKNLKYLNQLECEDFELYHYNEYNLEIKNKDGELISEELFKEKKDLINHLDLICYFDELLSNELD